MDIGVFLPTGKAQWGADGDPRELVAFGVRAEQLGFSSLFVNDSLISPRIEALTMLAALAPVTERVTLGTGALLPFLRRPVQAAQALASVDLLSGGRLAVAVGAGFPAALARTGRLYDGWLPYPPEPADYESGLLEIRNAAAQAGRSPDDITPALFVTVRVDRSLEGGRQVLGDYAVANYGMPLTELEKIQAIVTGASQQVADNLSRYIAAGARHLVIRLGALDLRSQRDQLEQVAALIPALLDRAPGSAQVQSPVAL